MMKHYRAALFDFDGVLSDSLEICIQEINRLRATFPTLPVIETQWDMATIYSVGLRDSLQRLGLSDSEAIHFFDLHGAFEVS